ncbi:DUF2975 domain-containing protein [Streptomyces sp. S.PB5]|uniref:DUF2975 domain-containing protein n=1 Tax=Streptomyces sp. S.PB5 TaxID=3020844 RepID=UPI0025AF8B60|nr:DUF2975 domain-containing protein [Streptomyces sp. S.PB5]MDN3028667.1 DUF2975 domain-containing protein [Streptomyces sp. S.PB5]
MSTTENRRMLEPMATIVSIVLRLLVALATVGLVLSVARGSWGGGVVCIADDMSITGVDDNTFGSPASGATADAIPRYCAENADTAMRLLNQLGELPTTLLLISSLFLLHRLLTGAARDGIYTTQTASRLRVLGWWLLAGSLLVAIVETTARTVLLADLAERVEFTPDSWLDMWSFPYLAVLTALGLLTFARITKAGVAMREDLEGVV